MENAAIHRRWPRWLVFLGVALIGLALRLPQLGARPMHTDEAINAYIIGQVLAGEPFSYDRQDRHGPALAALALPLSRLQGAKAFSDLTESELRLTSVCAGTITILLFGAAVEMFGFIPCLIAALLFAAASLPVYYDRYFIHESLFVAATFGLILSGWRVLTRNESPVPHPRDFSLSRGRETTERRTSLHRFIAQGKWNSVGQAALSGACAALMLASKETAFLHFFALAGAAFVFRFWNLRGKRFDGRARTKLIVPALVIFLLLSALLFTWFGANWKALYALWQAIPNVLARAGGEGHQKPFWYYAQLLAAGWSNGLLLALACIGFFLTVRKRDPSPYAFLAYYSFFLAAIYSWIPYKTPWLALNFWLPITLFAARAIESVWRIAAQRLPLRTAIPAFTVVGVVAAALIAHDTRQRVFLHPADEANPYAYAHTSEDVLGLPAEIEDMARRNAIAAPRIAVIAADSWPLPWYLRHFSQVGFWQPGQPPGDADFYITSTEAAGQYPDRFRNYRPDFFGVRPGVLIVLWLPAPK